MTVLIIDKTISVAYPDFGVLALPALKNYLEKLRHWTSALTKKKQFLLVLLATLVLSLLLAAMTTSYQTQQNFQALVEPLTPLITPTPAPASFGQAIMIDQNGEGIVINNGYKFNQQTFTAEAWVKWESYTPTYYDQPIIFKVKSGGSTPKASFSISTVGNSLEGQVTSDETTAIRFNFYPESMWRLWHHIALVNDASSETQITRFYVDGQLQGTATHLQPVNYGDGIGSLNIGVNFAPDNPDAANKSFVGKIDEVRISNNIRYTDNFSFPFSPFTADAATIGLYHFDNDAQDSSVYHNHGQIIGEPEFTESTVSKLFLNSSTNMNCNQICQENGLSCQSIGIFDTAATDGWYISGASLTCRSQSGSGCNQVMRQVNPIICSGHQTEWTICRCGDLVTPTPTPTAPTSTPTPTPTPTLIPTPTQTPTPALNLLLNPGFESGKTAWALNYGSGGQMTYSLVSGIVGAKAANISVTKIATPIQFYQTKLLLKKNTPYQLSFWAYSSSGHDFRVQALNHQSPFANVGLNQGVSLQGSWRQFTLDFTTNSSVTSNTRFRFWLTPYAANGDKYFIDEVTLREM